MGKVFVYDFATSLSEYSLGISGCGHAGRTGQALATSKNHLVFSEPAFNATVGGEQVLRAGRVLAVSWSSLLSLPSGDVKVCDLNSLLSEENLVQSMGNSFEARYGSSLAITSDASKVYVGAPLEDDTRGNVYSMDLTTGWNFDLGEPPAKGG